MSWNALLELLAAEVGQDAALRFERRARMELGGVRVTVGVRPWLPADLIDAAAPGRPREAARKLGISPQTAYQRLRRKEALIR